MKTRVLRADPKDPDLMVLRLAAEEIKLGNIVAFPTETVYGIGCNMFNESAVNKIYEIKSRDHAKPLQVLISDKGQLNLLSGISLKKFDRLISKFMPGPLTIVIPANENFPRWVNRGLRTVGVRMPDNIIALELIKLVGSPIAATSANMSNQPNPKDANDVVKYLFGKISLIIDAGPTPDDVPSTVIDLSVEPPVILRQGKLSEEEIIKELSYHQFHD